MEFFFLLLVSCVVFEFAVKCKSRSFISGFTYLAGHWSHYIIVICAYVCITLNSMALTTYFFFLFIQLFFLHNAFYFVFYCFFFWSLHFFLHRALFIRFVLCSDLFFIYAFGMFFFFFLFVCFSKRVKHTWEDIISYILRRCIISDGLVMCRYVD